MRYSYPNRVFQFWEYRVSHGSLLIRSPKNLTHDKNIDFIFFGVEYVELPRHLREGVVFERGNDSDVAIAVSALGRAVANERVFVLVTSTKRYLIVAAGYKIDVNENDIFDSPFER